MSVGNEYTKEEESQTEEADDNKAADDTRAEDDTQPAIRLAQLKNGEKSRFVPIIWVHQFQTGSYMSIMYSAMIQENCHNPIRRM